MRLAVNSIVMFYLLGLSSFVESFFGLSSRRKVFENPTIARWVSGSLLPDLENALPSFDDGYLCHAMKLSGQQRRICMRERGYPDVLMESLRLSARACQKEFQFERWNCTLGFTRRNLLRQANKESSVLMAFTAASMTYAMAKACSSGRLDTCSCDFNENRPVAAAARNSWMWGGCGDNIRDGRRQTERFFRNAPHLREQTHQKVIDKHNVQLGISVVKEASRRVCKCHGVSGSCTMRTCYTVLSPFKHAAKSMHEMYRTAQEKESHFTNNIPFTTSGTEEESQSNGIRSSGGRRVQRRRKKVDAALWFTEDSPDFCGRSKVSYGVSGRRCHVQSNPWKRKRKDNAGSCDHLCCGKKNTVARYEETTKKCKCTYSAFSINCLECRQREMRYYCKAT